MCQMYIQPYEGGLLTHFCSKGTDLDVVVKTRVCFSFVSESRVNQ